MTVTPTAPSERQPALDVLRGAALLGILLVNVQLMAGPQLIEQLFGLRDVTASTLERVLGGLIGWLVAGKFISSFSILFGVGAALIAERALARGRAPRRLLARRYVLLALAGLAHMVLLFPGDVLFLYGVTGLVLLAFLRARDRTLGVWIAALLVLSAFALTALTVSEAGTDVDAATMGLVATALADAELAYATGAYGGVVVWQALQSGFIQSSALVSLPWTLALFLIGMLAHRRGLSLDPAGGRATLVRLARVALPVGLVLNLPLLLTGPVAETASTADVALPVLIGAGIANAIGAPVLAVGYLSALAIVVVDRGAERGIRRRLAALGRIALTGYLLQSILALVVFFGFGAYGRVALLGEPILGMLAFVVSVWVALLAFAPWWTARFRYGPFEWLWRWGTYGVRPAMRG
ncbi:MAG: DUF418 domain-containing protein [Actinomycetota bacterium]|nr:DUF418 domain-containing protein [Actinomycetota bacterium]